MDAILQVLETSAPTTFTSPAVRTVSDTIVEYPNVNEIGFTDITIPDFPQPISTIPAAIDAGADFLDIDFSGAGSGAYISAFQNTYVFTFADAVAPLITAATIGSSTNLNLLQEDVTFSGNQLFVNMEGLTYSSSSFVRIDLTAEAGVEPSPVPLPAGLPLLMSGLLGFGFLARRRKTA